MNFLREQTGSDICQSGGRIGDRVTDTNIGNNLREVSYAGLPLLGYGVSGSVYRLDDERILKVYKKEVALSEVERQMRIAGYVYNEGIPTARMDELVKCGECYGVIAEYLDGPSLVHYIGKDSGRRIESADKMGKLLAKVHAMKRDPSVFPAASQMYRDVLARASDCIPDNEADRFAGLLDDLPGTPCVLHGDFHENNIMVRDGELILIDLDGMSIGSPVFELAQSYSVYRQTLPEEIAKAIGVTPDITQRFLETFLSSYLTDRGKKANQGIISKLDALFTQMCAYNLFLFPLLNGTITDGEQRRLYVSREIGRIYEMMDRANKTLEDLELLEVFA